MNNTKEIKCGGGITKNKKKDHDISNISSLFSSLSIKGNNIKKNKKKVLKDPFETPSPQDLSHEIKTPSKIIKNKKVLKDPFSPPTLKDPFSPPRNTKTSFISPKKIKQQDNKVSLNDKDSVKKNLFIKNDDNDMILEGGSKNKQSKNKQSKNKN